MVADSHDSDEPYTPLWPDQLGPVPGGLVTSVLMRVEPASWPAITWSIEMLAL